MRGLTREQFRDAADERLDYRKSVGRETGCTLMATDAFDLIKCKYYSRSGSRSCIVCHHHYGYEKVGDPFMSTVGTCSKCLQPRSIVNKKKCQCQECCYGKYKNMTSEQVIELRSKSPKASVRHSAIPIENRKARAIAAESVLIAPSDVEIYIDFKNDKELLESIRARAKKTRRPLGDEILFLLENNPIEIIRDGIEQLRKYPIPEGSPREVFQKAFDMVHAKLSELQA